MITLKNINLSSIDLSSIDLRGIKLGLGGRGGGSSDGFPQLPGDVTRWHFGGLTNEMMAAMDDPRIEDADGKGRFLSFKNFAWKGMSGVGGYVVDIDEWGTNSTAAYFERNSIKITATFKENASLGLLYHNIKLRQSCVLKVTGIPEGCDAFLDDRLGNRFYMSEDGVYEIIPSNFLAEALYLSIEKYPERWYGSKLTIEQLPLYPGFILSDGVDDFAVTEKELNFEDTYTVYTAFIPFQNNPANNMVLCGKNHLKDFYITYSDLNRITFYSAEKLVFESLSKGFNILCCKRTPDKMVIKNLITDKSSEILANDLIDNPGLYYLWKSAVFANYAKAGIAGQIIDNGHFTTDEEDENILNWHKKQYPWLFPDQAWTVTGKTNEDEDRATIANITGNGNDLVLSNFGFAEGSGYGLYAQNYISYAITNRAVYTKTNSSIHVTKSITAGVNFTESARDVTIPSYRIKVTGIQSGQEMIYRGSNNTFLTNIPSDGIYVLPAVENGSNLGFQFVSYTGDCDITIEQIPEYEGYLITDGVDDEIISAKLIQFADKFTIVGDWKFMEDRNDNAGLLKANQIYIYNATTGMRIYLKQGSKNYPFSCKKINALTSDGWVYDEKWDKYKVYPIGSDIDISSRLFLGFYSSNFTKIALKNLGIYNDQLLSKDDCIKAYNYLQTLKAK